MAMNRPLILPSDFGKKVAEALRGIKKDFSFKPVRNNASDHENPDNAIDGAVKEQVYADLDRLIEKHEK